MDQEVKVTIGGHEYLVRSEDDEEEIRKIAEYVNEKFKAIEDNTSGLSERKTAILAAFHIASDYFQALNERERLARNIKRRTKALIYHIDSLTS